MNTSDIKVRQSIHFNTAIVTPTTIEYCDLFPANVLEQSEITTKAKVTLESLSEDEQTIYKSLFATVGVKPKDYPNNVGISVFDEYYKLKYFTYPQIALEGNQLLLMIGASTTDKALTSVSVPIVNKGEGKYTINGKDVVIKPVDAMGDKKIPYLVFKNDDYIFNVNIKVDKDVKFEFLEAAFEAGKLELYTEPFFKNGASLSNVFSNLFGAKSFPKEGVLLLLENGAITEAEFSGKTVQSSKWRLAAIPKQLESLPVLTTKKDEAGNKLTDTLGSIGTFFCPSSAEPTKKLKATNGNGPNRIWLYVYGPNKNGNLGHCASHVAMEHSNRLPPPAIAAYNDMIKGALSGSNGSQNGQLQAVPSTSVDKELEEKINNF